MKKIMTVIISSVLIWTFLINCSALNMSVDDVNFSDVPVIAVDASASVNADLMIFAKAVVLMEKSTGKVLFAENENEQLFPASVTKIMSILLVCEALESGKITLEDKVSCSENAASKGGSQIWLEPGEIMTVRELLKATCIYSANDACTLLGEYVSGSETAFNELMNNRASQLGMTNTHFDNCTGLDDTTDTHLTTAYDVALMARELIKYDFIKQYTTTWLDSLRNGETQLVNTNKLVRFYEGITGLKTGTTEKAGCCVAATAERNGMELIAVVMGSDNSNDRFTTARNLLDWGFASFEIFTPQIEGELKESVSISFGEKDTVAVKYPEIAPVLINKGNSSSLRAEVLIYENIEAPVNEGDIVGKVIIYNGDKEISTSEIKSAETVGRLTFLTALYKLLTSFGK